MSDACEGATWLWIGTGAALVLGAWVKIIYREGQRSGRRERDDVAAMPRPRTPDPALPDETGRRPL